MEIENTDIKGQALKHLQDEICHSCKTNTRQYDA